MKNINFVIDNIKDFDLKQTFTCGQCFRWIEENDGSFVGVIKDGVLSLALEKDKLFIKGCFLNECSNDEAVKTIKHYLDLDRDYETIKKKLSKDDVNMKNAIKDGEGIRILNQDPWEMLISFIISACNNIPRISKTIQNISKAYGKKLVFEGKEYFLFPTPEELSKASVEDLRALNLGFRDKYVYNATKLVLEKKLVLEDLCNMKYEVAKKVLLNVNGVGSKVADCILLFACEKMEAFPVDTWIKKTMNELYLDSQNVKKIEEYAHNKFGDLAGVAQQYLFYSAREK